MRDAGCAHDCAMGERENMKRAGWSFYLAYRVRPAVIAVPLPRMLSMVYTVACREVHPQGCERRSAGMRAASPDREQASQPPPAPLEVQQSWVQACAPGQQGRTRDPPRTRCWCPCHT